MINVKTIHVNVILSGGSHLTYVIGAESKMENVLSDSQEVFTEEALVPSGPALPGPRVPGPTMLALQHVLSTFWMSLSCSDGIWSR